MVLDDGGRVGASACEGLGSFGLEFSCSSRLRFCKCSFLAGLSLPRWVYKPEVREVLVADAVSPDEKELLLDGVEGHAVSGIGGVRTAEDDLRPDIWFIFFETRGYTEGVEVAKSLGGPLFILTIAPVDVDRVFEEGCPVGGSWAGRFSRRLGFFNSHACSILPLVC